MGNAKPIKRHRAIAEFSRDHHYALLLVWKIREGLKRSVQAERISQYVLFFFETKLLPHFKGEEELLYCQIPSGHKLRIQAVAEHTVMYRMIDDLKGNKQDSELLQKFAGILENHVRFEERQLFNYLQENIPESELSKIESGLKVREHVSETGWADAFWEEKK